MISHFDCLQKLLHKVGFFLFIYGFYLYIGIGLIRIQPGLLHYCQIYINTWSCLGHGVLNSY
jgi:hypothetical protein